MADSDPQPRVFSYQEAIALLPEVRRRTEEAHRLVSELGTASAQDEERIGSVVREWAQAMVGMGLQVKGLWLVDFDNGSGYYCWKHPEDGLHYFHSYEEGFRGRMRIQ